MTARAFFRGLMPTALLLAASAVLTACSPSITLQADDKNGFFLTFTTGFSPASADTLRSLVAAVNGSVDDAMPVIPASDISTVLESSGFTDIQAENPTATSIKTAASYRSMSQGALPATGLVTRSKNSLTLTLGPQQLSRLYQLSNEDAQSYFDLLMIPALDENGGESSVADYTNLLASLYGKQFASELTGGSLHIELLSPDGKKKSSADISLGKALTSSNEQSWTVSW